MIVHRILQNQSEQYFECTPNMHATGAVHVLVERLFRAMGISSFQAIKRQSISRDAKLIRFPEVQAINIHTVPRWRRCQVHFHSSKIRNSHEALRKQNLRNSLHACCRCFLCSRTLALFAGWTFRGGAHYCRPGQKFFFPSSKCKMLPLSSEVLQYKGDTGFAKFRGSGKHSFFIIHPISPGRLWVYTPNAPRHLCWQPEHQFTRKAANACFNRNMLSETDVYIYIHVYVFKN